MNKRNFLQFHSYCKLRNMPKAGGLKDGSVPVDRTAMEDEASRVAWRKATQCTAKM